MPPARRRDRLASPNGRAQNSNRVACITYSREGVLTAGIRVEGVLKLSAFLGCRRKRGNVLTPTSLSTGKSAATSTTNRDGAIINFTTATAVSIS